MQQIVSGKINGFCSKLKIETIFSAKNPKILHFPYPEPLKAKSINRKKGNPNGMSCDV